MTDGARTLVRILYVEDDADIRTICKFALEISAASR